jgi:threonyl-tRNA synthetase
VLDLIDQAYAALGITAHRLRLSLRGSSDKYVDDPAMWDLGEQALAEVLDRRRLPYEAAAGEGAFYGPKIDVQILDQAGREFTLSTVQLDFHQPARFDLRTGTQLEGIPARQALDRIAATSSDHRHEL